VRQILRWSFAVLLLVASPAPAQQDAPTVARRWRESHAGAIIEEYFGFLRIPNVSRDLPNVRRNAETLMRMMAQRGIPARLLEVGGAAPVVYGELLSPGATHTYVFYAHYDGQPVNPADWTSPPFEPVLRSGRIDQGGRPIALPAPGQPIDPNWRIYARSASDDKAQIFSMLTALDALNAAGLKPQANIKFFFEGEEELSSPNLARVLTANRDLLKADLWLMFDGPEHSSGLPTITFGARGVQKLEITVYGPTRELHSGHYGNWAPNPALMLAQLLSSMKDADGRVLVDHFNDGVAELSALEKKALAELPDEDAALKRELGLARTEAGRGLAESINLPSLNIRGISSGRVGDQAANVIPAVATASLDLRLVKGVTHRQQAERVIAHIRKQGFFVVNSEPDAAARLAHPKIAKVVVGSDGYDAVRTPMDDPAAQRVVATIRALRGRLVLQPTSGGSVPLAVIEEILQTKTISVPIVNYDNSQHSHDENIKLANLWNGIETHAALLTMK
jgi:acetylornithine deacetylase/succinyl-diaminopimelate desuccinylase-like protein